MRSPILILLLCVSFSISNAQNGRILQATSVDQFEVIKQCFPNHDVLSNSQHILHVDSSAVNHQVIDSLTHVDCILYSQPNRPIYFRSTQTSDPFFTNQWPISYYNMESIWDEKVDGLLAGKYQLAVGVADNGFDIDHIDLASNVWSNPDEVDDNGIDDDNNGFIDDLDGWNFESDGNIFSVRRHGTSTAGIIGADSDNGQGIAGMTRQTDLILTSVSLGGIQSTEAAVVKAYDYYLELRKKFNNSKGTEGELITVINSSFGFDRAFPEDAPIWCGMYDALGESGILSVVASPNGFINIDEAGDLPCTCPSDYMICTSVHDESGNYTFDSGYGEENVDILAAGKNIFTLDTDDDYTSESGTSFAAPFVTSMVNLYYDRLDTIEESVFCEEPEKLALTIRDAILSSATQNSSTESYIRHGVLNPFRLFFEESVSIDRAVVLRNSYVQDGLIHVLANDFYTDTEVFIINQLGQLISTSIEDFRFGFNTLTIPQNLSGICFLKLKGQGFEEVFKLYID